MDEEFKLCWKNFQDNIASGFQNLYDRGDLVDVTLACDGKLLHAHKIVLAICSPYFQEIFITNPCKHPIIILKDVTFNIMCELLEFMYQGVVNVKHTELQSFMKIGQLLQIKGLATNASAAAASSPADKSSQAHNTDETSSTAPDADNNSDAIDKTSAPNRSNTSHGEDTNPTDGLSSVKLSNPISVKSHSPASSPSPMGFVGSSSSTINQQQSFKNSPESNMPLHQTLHTGAAASLKRHHAADINNDALSIYSRKQLRRSIASAEHNTTDHSDSADADGDSDYFLPSIPHLATNSTAAAAAAAFRNSFNPAAFGFDYNNLYNKSSGAGGGMGAGGSSGIGGAGGNNASGSGGGGSMEYPNDLHIPSDYKNFANHVDIPPNSSNVVMLSSTSLLHGNCVFNRNNTVATQQGMKTYWLCKSYRISMCRARCITHQGRVISATGVHNHPPHMRGGGGPGGGSGGPGNGGGGVGGNLGCGGDRGGFSLENTMQQTNASVPTSISPTMNLNSLNMSAGSGNVNSGLRLHHHTAGGGTGTMVGFQQHHNSPAQQLQLHHQQQQQQLQLQQQQQLHAVDGSTPPSPPTQMSSSANLHSAQSTTSPFMSSSHHSSGGDAGSLHHHHAALGAGGAGNGTAANSVIQNLLQNASTASMMHHHHHHPHHSQLPHMSHHLSQHAHDQSPHHHHQQHQPHLEITPLIHSPPLPPPPSSASLHLESPTNHSNQSQHGSGAANSLSSPITAQTASVASNSALKSPAQTNLSDDSLVETHSHRAHQQQQQHHMLGHHHGPTSLSPSEMNSNTATALTTHSTTDGAGISDNHQQQQHAHVIDSITISPSEGHNFKIEDM